MCFQFIVVEGDSLVQGSPREEEQRLSKHRPWGKLPLRKEKAELHGRADHASSQPFACFAPTWWDINRKWQHFLKHWGPFPLCILRPSLSYLLPSCPCWNSVSPGQGTHSPLIQGLSEGGSLGHVQTGKALWLHLSPNPNSSFLVSEMGINNVYLPPRDLGVGDLNVSEGFKWRYKSLLNGLECLIETLMAQTVSKILRHPIFHFLHSHFTKLPIDVVPFRKLKVLQPMYSS